MAIKNDGTVVAWGYNAYGQTNVPSGLSGVVAVAAGWYHSLALREDGTVTAWGRNSWSQTNVPAGLDNVVAVSAGADDSIALRNDGTVVAWGGGSSGQTNVPPWLSNVVAIASGQDHHLALLNDGSPYVTRQLWSQTAFSGAMVTFDAVVLGVRPFNFQWQFNGTDIPGATNAVLTLTNLPLTAAGNYRYVVSNPLGATTSQPATLTVLRSSPRFASTHAAIQFTNGGLALQMEGFSGHGDIVIYGSSNLLFWETIFTNPPVLGPFQFFDPTATNYPQRFYRAEER